MTAALIIATGKTDSDSAFQPLQRVGGITAIERQIHVFQMAGIERVVIVAGEEHQTLERQIARMGAVCLFNKNYQTAQMLDNVKLGLQALVGKCRRVLITPVDVALFSVETVALLADCAEKIAVPSHGRRAGHPLMLSAKFFGDVLAYDGAGGLSGAVKASGQAVFYLEVPDEGVLWDTRSHQDGARLVRQHSLQALHPEVKLYLAKEQVFFGPGPFLLLSLIEETESLRLACQQMGISYSKGWNMVTHMEKQAGGTLVARQRGGREKGRSDLTPAGRALLRAYTAFLRDCRQQVQHLFDKHFGPGATNGLEELPAARLADLPLDNKPD